MSNLAPASQWQRYIHLLYAPTLYCNLSCNYCYLGKQTSEADLKADAARAVQTLDVALAKLEAARVLAFNVSLHGGEVTTLPPVVLDALLTRIRQHYLRHFDAITALGQKKMAPHLKTNLYKFAPLYDLLARHKASISASIDLPLSLHAAHRLTKQGESWLDKTYANLRLLAHYPHAKKLSATLSQAHIADIPALIRDIWFIHRELGFDMNQFNLMFAFPSALNAENKGVAILPPMSEPEQLQLYAALQAEFIGTELEEGLRRHWFDEFTPSYCTNAFNCGERFYLLQSDGEVYSCVRGQGIAEFRYGNVYQDEILTILDTGAAKIRAQHQASGFAPSCQTCAQLARCHTGCPVVKYQERQAAKPSTEGAYRSYTCALQQQLYADNPVSYPPDTAEYQAQYAHWYAGQIHPTVLVAAAHNPQSTLPKLTPPAAIVLPNDLYADKNTLEALIAADLVLQSLYSDKAYVLDLDGELIHLVSQLRQQEQRYYTLSPGDAVWLHIRRDIFSVACDEVVRNTLYIQLLRDTPIVYGDEQRTKQEHIFSYQAFYQTLAPSTRLGDDYVMLDLGSLLALHQEHFQRGVKNNVLVTTQYLRDYHHQKQKNNAFYHIQAINLPFQNFEFFYVTPQGSPAKDRPRHEPT